jgi:hypothetical protein
LIAILISIDVIAINHLSESLFRNENSQSDKQKHCQCDRSFRTITRQVRDRSPKVSRRKAIAFPETKPLWFNRPKFSSLSVKARSQL